MLSLAVARLYLEDGLAQVPHLRIPQADQSRIIRYALKCPQSFLSVKAVQWGRGKEPSPHVFAFCLVSPLMPLSRKGAVPAVTSPCQLARGAGEKKGHVTWPWCECLNMNGAVWKRKLAKPETDLKLSGLARQQLGV